MPTNGQDVKIAHYTRSKFNSLTNKDSATIYYVEETNGEIKQYIGSVQVISDNVVKLSGAQTVAGIKTFSSIPVLPASDPTTANQAVRKSYVDTAVLNKTVSYSEITGSKPPVNATTNTGTVTNVSAGTQVSGLTLSVANGTSTPTITTSISNAANFRTAIGAGTGTSNLTIGTTASTAKAGNYQPTWSQVSGKPTFATVATSGSYNDLSNKPSIPSAYTLTKTKIDTALTGAGIPSIQIGPEANSGGDNSISLGISTTASGGSSIAIGSFTAASGTGSIAIGSGTVVTEDNVADFGSDRQVRVNLTPVNDRDAVSKKYLENNTRSNTWTPTWSQVSGKPSVIIEGDARLTNARPASDVSSWAKKSSLAIGDIPTGTTGSTVSLGNHTHSQYLTSFTESDPTVPAHVKSITSGNISSWNSKQNALGYTAENTANKRTSIRTSGANDTSYVSELGVKKYVDGLIGSVYRPAGDWNANTNSPTLANNTPANAGKVYRVSVAGTQFGFTFAIGDKLAFNESGIISKWDNVDDVTSVAGKTGAVVLTASDVGARASSWTPTWSQVSGKPTFATVATSGSYADLSNKPTIPAAQVAVNWNSTSGITAILNKPNLATVATSGSYADLSNKPTIPTIPSTMGTAEGNTGTAMTQRTINAANLKSIILNHSPAGSRPASDVSSWAKASSKPTYTAADVGARASNWTPTWSQVSGKPTDLVYTADLATKANDNEVVKLSGTQTISGAKTFDGQTTFGYNTGYMLEFKSSSGQAYMRTSSGKLVLQNNGDTSYSPVATESWVTSNTRSNTWTPTWSQVSGKPSWIGSSKPSYTASEVGARASDWTPSWSQVSSKPIATTAQAQAGTDNSTIMTPLRVKEAISATGGGGTYTLTKDKIDTALMGSDPTGVKLGYGASASIISTAVGYNASSVYDGTAFGSSASASATQSTALGSGATASGANSTAIGYSATTGSTQNRMQLGNTSLASLQSKVSLTVTSDIRDKADIEEVPKALDFIKDLNPITYVANDRDNYISEEQKETDIYKDYLMVEDYDKTSHIQGTKKGSRRRVGLSAQEVRDKLIEHYGSDNYANVVNDNFVEFEERDLDIPEGLENKLTMSYETMVPFLIKAIQEQQEQIEELKNKINNDLS